MFLSIYHSIKTGIILIILCAANFLPQSDGNIFPTINTNEIGLPLIKNYTLSDYGATPQNWGIVQDNRGVIYAANTGGVLEFDGVSWRLIEIKNEIVRSIAIDEKGTIYVGGVDQIGFLESDSSGKLKFNSLISLLPFEERNFGDIWSIWPSKQGVFFQSASHLFLIKEPVKSFKEEITTNVKLWKTNTVFSPAFLVYDNFYIPELHRGLLTLIGDSLKLISSGEYFKDRTIYTMLPYPVPPPKNFKQKKILIGTATQGFLIYDGEDIKRFKTEADEYIVKNQLYFRGVVLENNTYAFGTQNGGLLVIDEQGKLKHIINKQNGLKDNTVWFVFPDRSGGLWLCLNNGIARLNLPSPLSVIDSRFGLDGTIFSMNNNKKFSLVTTQNGAFYYNTEQKRLLFNKIEGIYSESWEILDLGKTQLVATTNGVFEIYGSKAQPIITAWRFAYCFYRSQIDPATVYVGLHDGLAKLNFKNGKWQDGGRIPGVSEIIFSIAEEKNGTLWLSTYNKGLIKLIPGENKNNTSYSITKYGIEQGVPEKQIIMLAVKNKIIFGTADGIISYDKVSDKFKPDLIFGNYFTENYKLTDLKKDIAGNIWIAGEKRDESEIIRLTLNSKNRYEITEYPVLKSILDNEIGFVQLRLHPDKLSADILWISSVDKLYRFDLKSLDSSKEESKFNTLIRKVSISGDSIIYSGGYLPEEITGESREWYLFADLNSIEFSFSATSYSKESANRYQYLLEGFDQRWSDWIKETRKEYTNLSAGEYNFKVRGKNIYGQISNAASFRFYIPVPWYKSVWAYLIYIILFALLILYAVKIRLRYLEKRTIELESIVDKRTQQVRKQKDLLEEQAKKLLELDRLKSNFFTNISHEFRTPLTLIMGQIENLLTSSSEEHTKTKLKMALSNSKRLHTLINQLLELSRLESGEMKLKISKVEINQYLKKIIAAFDSLADRKKIKLELNSTGAGLYLFIDPEKMEEVLNNLISNSIKFTPDGGKISISLFELKDENAVNIVIKDDGIGISKEALEHIFDRFYQVDSSQTREFEGTGIGLAIVKELVELHKGTISVESEHNRGTEFTIQLYKGKQHLENEQFVEIKDEYLQIGETSTNSEIYADRELTYKTELEEDTIEDGKEEVLIVEDNSDMRSYINQNLENFYKVIEAKNGEEGVIKAIESIPDLIITDVMMPGMNGFDLTAKLKSDPKTSHIPIIMLTAKADEESKLKGLNLGVDDYLIKPFSTKELHARVGNLIKLRTLLKERYKEISAINPSEIEAKPIDQEFLEKVFNSITTHLEDPQFGVTILADEAGMSVSQLNRKLNALIHQSAGKLIRSTRLDYAAEMLKKNAGTVSEIGYKIGFSDHANFTKSFKDKFGISPTEYIKRNKPPA